jgi:hypothetical protein
MTKPKAVTEPCCPSCLSPEVEDTLIPYCSYVCRLLGRYGLGWRTNPYHIVVATHPHLIVQPGPDFDLRESALKGARERTLATERKHRQRDRDSAQDVTPTEQDNASIGVPFAIPGVENVG